MTDLYPADPDKFAKSFPDRIDRPPRLLLDFAHWLSDKPWGSVGSFSLSAEWSDHILVEGERHKDSFALFIRMPTGSLGGFWLEDRPTVEGAPIVMLGSEGEYETLAPDLPHFIARLAVGDFGERGDGSDFLPNEYQEVPDLRPALARWLADKVGGGVERLKGWKAADPDPIDVWVKQATRDIEAEADRDPRVLAISKALEPYRPAAGSPKWSSNRVYVAWAGDHVEIVDASHGHKPVPERDAVLRPLGELRDEAARRSPGVGLWHYAWITIYSEGPAEIRTEYLDDPKFFLGRPADDAFRADQARMPRAARRIPGWLAKIIET